MQTWWRRASYALGSWRGFGLSMALDCDTHVFVAHGAVGRPACPDGPLR